MPNSQSNGNVSSRLGNYIGEQGQALAANDFRQDLHQDRQGEDGASEEGEQADGEGENEKDPSRYRQIMNKTKQMKEALDLKKKAKEKIKEAVLSPIKMFTSGMLKKSWLIVATGVGTLPSLLYINLHALGRSVFGENFFCKFGEEWIPNSLKGEAREKAIESSRKLKIVEEAGLAGLDLLLVLAIISILALLGVVGYAYAETVKLIWQVGREALGALIKALKP